MLIIHNRYFFIKTQSEDTDMDYTKLAIAGGILFAAYKFAPNDMVKGGVLSIAAVIAAKQIPYVKDYV